MIAVFIMCLNIIYHFKIFYFLFIPALFRISIETKAKSVYNEYSM